MKHLKGRKLDWNKRMKRYRKVREGELRQILFWAVVGFCYSQGGSYSQTAPLSTAKLAKRLNLKRENFCCLRREGYLDSIFLRNLATPKGVLN